jgi:hypothetical protein
MLSPPLNSRLSMTRESGARQKGQRIWAIGYRLSAIGCRFISGLAVLSSRRLTDD